MNSRFLVGVLALAGCASESAPPTMQESKHEHYHVHGAQVEHEHAHQQFDSGGHNHPHQHPLADLPQPPSET
ncbi:MAG: hypothetical protein KDA37_09395 [Planctomycetales bacterium]|nr:hypothetical protein [Planctomycetales bacterium]